MKICVICGQKHNRHSDFCSRACYIADYIRRYREANKERLAEQHRRYYEANKERLAEWHRRYREVNKERLAEQYRRYYEANKERLAEQHRRYYEANKERLAEQHRRYREAQIPKCTICGGPIPKERQHTHYCSSRCYYAAFREER